MRILRVFFISIVMNATAGAMSSDDYEIATYKIEIDGTGDFWYRITWPRLNNQTWILTSYKEESNTRYLGYSIDPQDRYLTNIDSKVVKNYIEQVQNILAFNAQHQQLK